MNSSPRPVYRKYSFPIRLLEWMNVLSLDVSIGALLSGLFVAVLFGVEMNWVYWVVLPLSVWIFYMLDHLVDAYRLKQKSHTRRHLFAYQYFRALTTIIVLFSISDLMLVFLFLDLEVLFFGIGLGLLSLIYFLFLHLFSTQKMLLFNKEIIVAVIYVTGLWGIPLIMVGFEMETTHYLLLIGFLIVVFADVLLLSFYEFTIDTKDSHDTLAVHLGEKRTGRVVGFLCAVVICIAITIFLISSNELFRTGGIIYMVMAGLIWLMVLYPDVFRRNRTYRYLSEMIFWLPGLAGLAAISM